MIENLKQIEDKMLLSLLMQPDKWNTLLIDYFPPIVERCWIQLGNYRFYLHFIHKCEAKDALFHPHPWPSAMHVLSGKYEMGLGFGSGMEEPEKMCTVVLENGGAYYDMTHIDGWHYVRPIGDVCATVMLTGKPWERDEVKSPGKLGPLSMQKKLIMLKWFEEFYRNKVHGQKVIDNEKIGKSSWVKLDESAMSANDKRGMEKYFGVLGFVIGRDKNFIDVRFGNDRTKVHSRNLVLLDPSDKPVNIEAEKKKLDDMDPSNWEDDDKDENV